MASSSFDSWDGIRQGFAAQFVSDGSGFIYRRFQKGEAIRISSEERARFVDEFDRRVRRLKWIIYLGLTLAMGTAVLISALREADLSQITIFAAIGVVMIPYFAYSRWAWTAPTRELGSRTPIARELTPEEVWRLRFRRITYVHLAAPALCGLVLPFVASAPDSPFVGWNRLWLVFGAALIAFAGFQAFRKWQFDQDETPSDLIPPASTGDIDEAEEESAPIFNGRLWRCVPLAVLFLGIAFIAFTPPGKRLAQTPSVWPIALIGIGTWSLVTVARGFMKGSIGPIAKGFYNTYRRDTEPKRFWASMAWNSVLAGLLFWLAFGMSSNTASEAVERACYNEQNTASPQQELAACNKLIASPNRSDRAYLLGARAWTYQRLNDQTHALADYDEAIRLNPRDPYTRFNRGVMYQQRGDTQPAIADFTAVIEAQPNSAEAYLQRGSAYEHLGRLRLAIVDFDQAVRLKPNLPDGYYYRAEAYANLGNDEQAQSDYAFAKQLNPKLSNPYR